MKAIITFGVGYGFDDIKYFIHSCSVHTTDTDIYIYVGDNIEELRDQCIDYKNVHLIRYREKLIPKIISKVLMKFPSLAKAYARILMHIQSGRSKPSSFLNSLAVPLVQFMVKRFFIIYDLLKKLPHDQIMLTDIRDVLVQADPFREITNDKVIITGIEPVKVEQSEMNSRWIVKTYGEVVYHSLKHNLVACAGVTIGSRKAIDQYIEEMIQETYKCMDRIIGMLGADQAIHIQLFYHKLNGLEKHLEANGSGSIATLHFSKLNEFFIGHGKIENYQGKELAVVHQYDRHYQLAAQLKNEIEHHLSSRYLILA